jgi:hypothetical protein
MADWEDRIREFDPSLVSVAITGFLTLAASLQLLNYAWSRQLVTVSLKWQIGLVFLAVLILLEGAAFRFLSSRTDKERANLNAGLRLRLATLGLARPLILLVLILLPVALFLHVEEVFASLLLVRLTIVWILIIATAEILRSIRPQTSWLVGVCGAALLIGSVYRLGLLAQEISAYPLSLGWSEASRYYYASLYFSRRIYGFQVPPSVLHPTRYLLQSIPFIVPGLPIVVHRVWQVLLWVSTTVATGYLLARRLGVRSKTGYAAMIALAVLYLFQGPVYYHLLVMVILVLWLFDGERPWRSLAVILLASAWAGISRINWYPVPAILGAVLYLLEIPRRDRNLVGYMKWPVVWVALGTAIAFLSQLAYIAWSGQPAEQFSSSFSSGLLWYRLLPNPTYPLGVLLAILLASFPALLLFWIHRHRLIQGLAWPRSLGLAAILLVLLAGGLVVSVKIGGGSNLHNLDAYLVVLGVIAAFVYSGKLNLEAGRENQPETTDFRFLPLFIAVPLIFTLSQGGPIQRPLEFEIDRSLQALREYTGDSDKADQQILFISQRHLLTFDMIEGARLIPGYETVFLMEMAMSGDENYLSAFHTDLAEHRFDMIVVDPLTTGFQGRSHAFGEENDAWVREVSLPILCYYEPLETFGETRVQILAPRDDSCEAGAG